MDDAELVEDPELKRLEEEDVCTLTGKLQKTIWRH